MALNELFLCNLDPNTKGTQVTEMGMVTKLTQLAKHCKGPLLLWHKRVFIPTGRFPKIFNAGVSRYFYL